MADRSSTLRTVFPPPHYDCFYSKSQRAPLNVPQHRTFLLFLVQYLISKRRWAAAVEFFHLAQTLCLAFKILVVESLKYQQQHWSILQRFQKARMEDPQSESSGKLNETRGRIWTIVFDTRRRSSDPTWPGLKWTGLEKNATRSSPASMLQQFTGQTKHRKYLPAWDVLWLGSKNCEWQWIAFNERDSGQK